MTDFLLNRLHTTTLPRPKQLSKSSNDPLEPTYTASGKSTENAAIGALSRALKGVNSLVLSLRDGLGEQEREHRRKVDERRQILCLRMRDAETRKQWQDAAEELDIIERNDQWKLDPFTADYNPALIESRLKDLDEARTNCDIRAMLYQVRTALSRDLGGMGNVDLYRHSYVGTKELIERYVDSALQTIDSLVEKSQHCQALPEGISQRDILESLLFTRQSFGRSALLLSGGGTFGMSHIGVLKALFEVKLLPRIISGASAGSIVCAVMCTRTDEEIPQVIRDFPYGDLSVFDGEDKPDGVSDRLRRLLTEGSWSDIKHLTRVMRGLLGDITFQEAYNRTRRILNICVSTESVYELPRLLNYVTAPNVMIWSAVAASCSVPLVFSGASLLVKVPNTGEHMPWNPTPQRWIDGSVDNDLPMTRLAEMFNVNHFIVSQVNPHVVPFLAKDDQLRPSASWNVASKSDSITPTKDDPDWIYTLTALAKDEAMHRLQFLAEIGLFPNLATKLRSVLSQKYSGDINILPEISVHDMPRLLSNPTSDFMLRACLSGERATWPKLSRIRDRCAIELGLDQAVHRLRARVVFSDSQVDLRRLATGFLPPPPAPPPIWPKSAAKCRAQASTEKTEGQGPSPDLRGYQPPKTRQRRSSGSSLQLFMSQHRRLMMENDLTDEETEEEERLEMLARRGAGDGSSIAGTGMAPRKPRLKRSAKSQSHFSTTSLFRGSDSQNPPLAPRPERVGREFDFGSAPTPPAHPDVSLTTGGNVGKESDSTDRLAPAVVFRPRSNDRSVSATRGIMASPSDEPETSEIPSQSSASGEEPDSHTEDTASDVGPYDGSWPLARPAHDAISLNKHNHGGESALRGDQGLWS